MYADLKGPNSFNIPALVICYWNMYYQYAVKIKH